MFTHLIESILPIDYYSVMAGVIVDQKIFIELFMQKFPKVA